MLNKIIETLGKLDLYKHNPIFAKEANEEAAVTFNAGWDALEDGRVVSYKGDYVMVKKGDSVVVQEMIKNQWNIKSGKLTGGIKRIIETRPIDTDDKKAAGVAQAIITRFYTIPGM